MMQKFPEYFISDVKITNRYSQDMYHSYTYCCTFINEIMISKYYIEKKYPLDDINKQYTVENECPSYTSTRSFMEFYLHFVKPDPCHEYPGLDYDDIIEEVSEETYNEQVE